MPPRLLLLLLRTYAITYKFAALSLPTLPLSLSIASVLPLLSAVSLPPHLVHYSYICCVGMIYTTSRSSRLLLLTTVFFCFFFFLILVAEDDVGRRQLSVPPEVRDHSLLTSSSPRRVVEREELDDSRAPRDLICFAATHRRARYFPYIIPVTTHAHADILISTHSRRNISARRRRSRRA